jgi:hypothetical protein
MARTTLADVRATLAGQSIALDDVDLFRYVTAASTFVDEELADRGLGDAHPKEFEKYLAAHLTALRDITACVSCWGLRVCRKRCVAPGLCPSMPVSQHLERDLPI